MNNEKETALLVSLDSINLCILRDVVSGLGYVASRTKDIKSAKLLIEKQHFRLFILDVSSIDQLSEYLSLVNFIKDCKFNCLIIILLNRLNSEKYSWICGEGVNEIVTKPITSAAFTDKIGCLKIGQSIGAKTSFLLQ
ncbi:hypothetical protein ISS03_01905 [Patescibacteria group bacterium]|nr:hypothetical protein [Patescibacteria group bacterium]